MSLSQVSLQNSLLRLVDPNRGDFVGFPANETTAIANWADAYHAYADGAHDAGGNAVGPRNIDSLKAVLAGLPEQSGTALQAAQIWDAAFVSYWTGVVFLPYVPPPGGVGGTGVFSMLLSSHVNNVATNVLTNLLQPIFAIASANASSKASDLAAAFHTATTTAVTVLMSGLDTTPTPSGPLPITNLGTVVLI